MPLPLPLPDSPELDDLGITGVHRLIYDFLYRRRDHPPTMLEIRALVASQYGEDQSQTDRRVRDLRTWFAIPAVVIDGEHRYRLEGWNPRQAAPNANQISLRVRAQVLAPGRCAQCGRTPLADHVKLVVDHKVPQNWGGGNELENLQPLCEDCNAGKQDRYSSYNAYAEKISHAVLHEEPHRRIAELLLAFEGDWVPGDLIEVVASAIQYQEDWQKRLRELRVLGWVIEVKRSREGYRVRTYYRATATTSLPEDNLRRKITALERQRAADRASNSDGEDPGPDDSDRDE